LTLSERLLALHAALSARRIPHAFGGAIALAYWTENPRGTQDIDVNVFVSSEDPGRVLAVLPEGIAQPEGTADAIARDGQIRLWWGETPIDLFFQYAPVHEQAASNRHFVDFLGHSIPVLGPNELAVFKAMFARTQDWADIEALVANDALDVDTVSNTLRPMLPSDDDRLRRLAEAIRRGRAMANADESPPGVPAWQAKPQN
jgi:hypothetical protein